MPCISRRQLLLPVPVPVPEPVPPRPSTRAASWRARCPRPLSPKRTTTDGPTHAKRAQRLIIVLAIAKVGHKRCSCPCLENGMCEACCRQERAHIGYARV